MKRFLIPAICLATASLMLAQAPPAAPKPGKGVSKAEAQAIQAMIQAQSPDDRIAAAENLINKFGNTSYKGLAFYVEADSYVSKNDNAKAMVYAEQSIAADPKNYDATVLLANLIACTTRDTDLDKDEKIARVNKLSNETIEALKTAEKPNPQMTDDQFKTYKASDTAQAYQALGTIAIVDKKFDDAIKDFQAGIDADPDPLLMIRAGRALLAIKKYDEAIGWFDKAAAAPGVPDQIKNIAASDKARATAAKGK